MKPLPLSYFGEDWREREADLLFEHQRLREIVRVEVPDRFEEADRMSMTIVESWFHDGEVRAFCCSLCDVLEERFGELPEALKQQIESMTDTERLRTAHRQSLKIKSLDELGL
jgi:hypothetical protein